MRFYILVQQRKPTDKDKGSKYLIHKLLGLGIVAEHRFIDLKRILYGMFLQFIR